MRPKPSDWIVPFVTAAVGVLVVFALGQIGTPDFEATVVEGSVVDLGNDFVEVEVTFGADLMDGPLTATVIVPEDEVTDGIVPVWLFGEQAMTVDPYRPVFGDFLLGGFIGALLGVVMVMTMRGFGYVRGDGEPGSKPYVPVGEEQGFYWRT